jgi:hypothetical protein
MEGVVAYLDKLRLKAADIENHIKSLLTKALWRSAETLCARESLRAILRAILLAAGDD